MNGIIDRLDATVHRYAVLLLLVFFVFALFDLLYVGPMGRDIRRQESVLESAREKVDGLNKELARLKAFERASASSLATLLADTAEYAAATAETALLHRLSELADACGLSTDAFTVRRTELPEVAASAVAFDFGWRGDGPAVDAFLDGIASSPFFALIDRFESSDDGAGAKRGELTVTLFLRKGRAEAAR